MARRGTYEYLPGADTAERVVNDIRAGQIDCGGELTMEAGSTSTVLLDTRLSVQSIVMLSPRSAAASTVNWHVSAKATGKVTITHDSVAGDRGFDWIALG